MNQPPLETVILAAVERVERDVVRVEFDRVPTVLPSSDHLAQLGKRVLVAANPQIDMRSAEHQGGLRSVA